MQVLLLYLLILELGVIKSEGVEELKFFRDHLSALTMTWAITICNLKVIIWQISLSFFFFFFVCFRRKWNGIAWHWPPRPHTPRECTHISEGGIVTSLYCPDLHAKSNFTLIEYCILDFNRLIFDFCFLQKSPSTTVITSIVFHRTT